MDETEETKENPLSETETASDGSEGTTPKGEAKTQYTQEEVDKLLQADRIKRGRDDKALETRKTDLDAKEEAIRAREAKVAEREAAEDAAELAEAKTDPDKMAAYKAKQAEKSKSKSLDEREAAIKKERAELDRNKAEHAERVRAAEEVTLGMKLYEIAARHELNPEDLKAGVEDLNLTTEAQAEALAKRMKPTGERPPGGETKGEEEQTIPVTVPTTGGSHGKLTPEEADKLSMEDYADRRRKEQPDKFPL